MIETKKRGNTYVAIVLDRSGSMGSVKEQTVKGYNEQVRVLLEEAAKPDRGETFASLVTFSGSVREEFFNAPIEILREMHPSQYNPDGWTAMRDAVGYTVEKLCTETDPNDEFNSYLVIVMSDGEENRSRFWSAERLAQKVNELHDTNRWTFTYIGANQDLRRVQEQTGFKAGNMIAYEASARGTTTAFSSNAQQMKKWLGTKSKGENTKNFSTDDYFEGAKTADESVSKG